MKKGDVHSVGTLQHWVRRITTKMGKLSLQVRMTKSYHVGMPIAEFRLGCEKTHGPGAGTPDFSSPEGSPNTHWDDDVLPYLWALELDGGTPGTHVNKYLEVRPPNKGRDPNTG